jgi:hypothetical protein
MSVHRGMDVLEKDSAEQVIVFADSITPVEGMENAGNWQCGLSITYTHLYENTGSLATFYSNLDTITSASIGNSNIINDLVTNTNNLGVYAVYFNGMTQTAQDNHWIAVLNLTMICCQTA